MVPVQTFHGRHTSVRSICPTTETVFLPQAPLKSQVRGQPREGIKLLCYRQLEASAELLAFECKVGLSRGSVGVRLDTSFSDSRILALDLHNDCRDSIDRTLFVIIFLAVVRQSYCLKRRSCKTVECVNFPAMLYCG